MDQNQLNRFVGVNIITNSINGGDMNNSGIEDINWKNELLVNEYRTKAIQFINNRLPSTNRDSILKAENQIFSQSTTKVDYNSKIAMLTQQNSANQQQQQQQQQMNQIQQQVQQINSGNVMIQAQSMHQTQIHQQQVYRQVVPKTTPNQVQTTNQQNTILINKAPMVMQQQQQQQQPISMANLGQQQSIQINGNNSVILNNVNIQQQQIISKISSIQQMQAQQQLIRPNILPQQPQFQAQNISHIQTPITYNLNNNTAISAQLIQQQPNPNQLVRANINIINNNTNNILVENDEVYKKKVEELTEHLPRLEKMLLNAAGRVDEAKKIKALIEVVKGEKKVTLDILIRCENTLLNLQQKSQLQIQQQQQQQRILQQQQQQLQQQQQQTSISIPVITQQFQQQSVIPAGVVLQNNQQSNNITSVILNQQQQLQLQQHQKNQILQQQLLLQQHQQQQHNLTKSQSLPMQQIIKLDSTPQQQQQQQQVVQINAQNVPPPTEKRLSLTDQVMKALNECNAANPVHKNNVRYIIDSVLLAINGPSIQETDPIFETDDDGEASPKKRRINIRDHQNHPKKRKESEIFPHKLLIELSLVCDQKFEIEVNFRRQSAPLIIPSSSIPRTYSSFEVKTEPDQKMNVDNEKQYKTISDKDYVSLKCNIINRRLPLVPPIKILVPYNYPNENPIVDCLQLDSYEDEMLPGYDKMGIFRRINKHFQNSYGRLTERYSVSQLLDAWYCSVESL